MLRVRPIYSLRTQLGAGTIVLLSTTFGLASWAIIAHGSHSIEQERERAVLLQGRNIALACEKALQRTDPELEIYPLVTRAFKNDGDVTMLVITDASGKIIAHPDLVNVGHPFAWKPGHMSSRGISTMVPGEELFADAHETVAVLPLRSPGVRTGTVYLGSSKAGLRNEIREMVWMSVAFAGGGLVLGVLFALSFFDRIASPLTVLLNGVRRLAEGDVDTQIEARTRNEIGVLASAFNEMATRMKAARADLVVKERLDREFELARDVQQTLLPRHETLAPFVIGHHYEAAYEVGGDLIDFVPVGKDRLGFVIADVSGKGLVGLVVMAMVKVLVHRMLATDMAPSDVLKKLDASLRGNLRPNMFVSAFVATVDATSGAVLAANAGHNPLLVYRRGERRSSIHRLHGPPLGIVPPEIINASIVDHEFHMEAGDILLQYTDGIPEAMDAEGNQFSMERMQHVVDAHGGEGVDAMMRALIGAERRFRGNAPQNDDIAILAIGFDQSRKPVEAGDTHVAAN